MVKLLRLRLELQAPVSHRTLKKENFSCKITANGFKNQQNHLSSDRFYEKYEKHCLLKIISHKMEFHL